MFAARAQGKADRFRLGALPPSATILRSRWSREGQYPNSLACAPATCPRAHKIRRATLLEDLFQVCFQEVKDIAPHRISLLLEDSQAGSTLLFGLTFPLCRGERSAQR